MKARFKMSLYPTLTLILSSWTLSLVLAQKEAAQITTSSTTRWNEFECSFTMYTNNNFKGKSWEWRIYSGSQKPKLDPNFRPQSIQSVGQCTWEICYKYPCSSNNNKRKKKPLCRTIKPDSKLKYQKEWEWTDLPICTVKRLKNVIPEKQKTSKPTETDDDPSLEPVVDDVEVILPATSPIASPLVSVSSIDETTLADIAPIQQVEPTVETIPTGSPKNIGDELKIDLTTLSVPTSSLQNIESTTLSVPTSSLQKIESTTLSVPSSSLQNIESTTLSVPRSRIDENNNVTEPVNNFSMADEYRQLNASKENELKSKEQNPRSPINTIVTKTNNESENDNGLIDIVDNDKQLAEQSDKVTNNTLNEDDQVQKTENEASLEKVSFSNPRKSEKDADTTKDQSAMMQIENNHLTHEYISNNITQVSNIEPNSTIKNDDKEDLKNFPEYLDWSDENQVKLIISSKTHDQQQLIPINNTQSKNEEELKVFPEYVDQNDENQVEEFKSSKTLDESNSIFSTTNAKEDGVVHFPEYVDHSDENQVKTFKAINRKEHSNVDSPTNKIDDETINFPEYVDQNDQKQIEEFKSTKVVDQSHSLTLKDNQSGPTNTNDNGVAHFPEYVDQSDENQVKTFKAINSKDHSNVDSPTNKIDDETINFPEYVDQSDQKQVEEFKSTKIVDQSHSLSLKDNQSGPTNTNNDGIVHFPEYVGHSDENQVKTFKAINTKEHSNVDSPTNKIDDETINFPEYVDQSDQKQIEEFKSTKIIDQSHSLSLKDNQSGPTNANDDGIVHFPEYVDHSDEIQVKTFKAINSKDHLNLDTSTNKIDDEIIDFPEYVDLTDEKQVKSFSSYALKSPLIDAHKKDDEIVNILEYVDQSDENKVKQLKSIIIQEDPSNLNSLNTPIEPSTRNSTKFDAEIEIKNTNLENDSKHPQPTDAENNNKSLQNGPTTTPATISHRIVDSNMKLEEVEKFDVNQQATISKEVDDDKSHISSPLVVVDSTLDGEGNEIDQWKQKEEDDGQSGADNKNSKFESRFFSPHLETNLAPSSSKHLSTSNMTAETDNLTNSNVTQEFQNGTNASHQHTESPNVSTDHSQQFDERATEQNYEQLEKANTRQYNSPNNHLHYGQDDEIEEGKGHLKSRAEDKTDGKTFGSDIVVIDFTTNRHSKKEENIELLPTYVLEPENIGEKVTTHFNSKNWTDEKDFESNSENETRSKFITDKESTFQSKNNGLLYQNQPMENNGSETKSKKTEVWFQNEGEENKEDDRLAEKMLKSEKLKNERTKVADPPFTRPLMVQLTNGDEDGEIKDENIQITTESKSSPLVSEDMKAETLERPKKKIIVLNNSKLSDDSDDNIVRNLVFQVPRRQEETFEQNKPTEMSKKDRKKVSSKNLPNQGWRYRIQARLMEQKRIEALQQYKKYTTTTEVQPNYESHHEGKFATQIENHFTHSTNLNNDEFETSSTTSQQKQNDEIYFAPTSKLKHDNNEVTDGTLTTQHNQENQSNVENRISDADESSNGRPDPTSNFDSKFNSESNLSQGQQEHENHDNNESDPSHEFNQRNNLDQHHQLGHRKNSDLHHQSGQHHESDPHRQSGQHHDSDLHHQSGQHHESDLHHQSGQHHDSDLHHQSGQHHDSDPHRQSGQHHDSDLHHQSGQNHDYYRHKESNQNIEQQQNQGYNQLHQQNSTQYPDLHHIESSQQLLHSGQNDEPHKPYHLVINDGSDSDQTQELDENIKKDKHLKARGQNNYDQQYSDKSNVKLEEQEILNYQKLLSQMPESDSLQQTELDSSFQQTELDSSFQQTELDSSFQQYLNSDKNLNPNKTPEEDQNQTLNPESASELLNNDSKEVGETNQVETLDSNEDSNEESNEFRSPYVDEVESKETISEEECGTNEMSNEDESEPKVPTTISPFETFASTDGKVLPATTSDENNSANQNISPSAQLKNRQSEDQDQETLQNISDVCSEEMLAVCSTVGIVVVCIGTSAITVIVYSVYQYFFKHQQYSLVSSANTSEAISQLESGKLFHSKFSPISSSTDLCLQPLTSDCCLENPDYRPQ